MALCGPTAQAVTVAASASGSVSPQAISFPGTVLNGNFLIEPNPGCTGPATNCGLTGDGVNDQTTWTFDFRTDPQFNAFLLAGPLSAATLDITLTVKEAQITTDVLRIRGLVDITAQIQDLSVGQTATVRFDLLAVYGSDAILSNLSATLIGGTLPKSSGELLMLYQDDAIVSAASLSLTAVPAPTALFGLLTGIGMLTGFLRRGVASGRVYGPGAAIQ